MIHQRCLMRLHHNFSMLNMEQKNYNRLWRLVPYFVKCKAMYVSISVWIIGLLAWEKHSSMGQSSEKVPKNQNFHAFFVWFLSKNVFFYLKPSNWWLSMSATTQEQKFLLGIVQALHLYHLLSKYDISGFYTLEYIWSVV